MKISIITSVLNSCETIRDTIDSVLSQDYENIEYIIIDAASTDGTLDIIKSYGDRITKYISEKDKGIYDGLNKGIEIATGDVIGFLHSDDTYADNEIIVKIANVFMAEDLDGIYGDLVYTRRQDTTKILRYWKSRKFESKLLAKGWMPAHPTLFLKNEIYKRFGNYNINYKIAADYDFILRIFSKNIKTKYLPGVIYRMRASGESNKNIKNIFLKSKEDLNVLRKNNVGGIWTLLLKNFSKIPQFIKSRR